MSSYPSIEAHRAVAPSVGSDRIEAAGIDSVSVRSHYSADRRRISAIGLVGHLVSILAIAPLWPVLGIMHSLAWIESRG